MCVCLRVCLCVGGGGGVGGGPGRSGAKQQLSLAQLSPRMRHTCPGVHTLPRLRAPQVNTLNTLDEMGLTDKTLIIRTADHGEMGMAHGTQIQKNFNM